MRSRDLSRPPAPKIPVGAAGIIRRWRDAAKKRREMELKADRENESKFGNDYTVLGSREVASTIRNSTATTLPKDSHVPSLVSGVLGDETANQFLDAIMVAPEARTSRDIDNLTPVLSQVDFIQSLDAPLQRELLRHVTYRTFRPMESIILQGEVGQHYFVILSGITLVCEFIDAADVALMLRHFKSSPLGGSPIREWGATTRLEYRGKFEVVGTMRPGRGFGEACMDGRGGRAMASVVSYTPLEVASIDRAVYQRLLWEHHERGLSLKMGALRRHPIMADLGDEDVRALAYCATTLRFPARATIVREGDPSDQLYVIISGEASILKQFSNEKVRQHFADVRNGLSAAFTDEDVMRIAPELSIFIDEVTSSNPAAALPTRPTTARPSAAPSPPTRSARPTLASTPSRLSSAPPSRATLNTAPHSRRSLPAHPSPGEAATDARSDSRAWDGTRDGVAGEGPGSGRSSGGVSPVAGLVGPPGSGSGRASPVAGLAGRGAKARRGLFGSAEEGSLPAGSPRISWASAREGRGTALDLHSPSKSRLCVASPKRQSVAADRESARERLPKAAGLEAVARSPSGRESKAGASAAAPAAVAPGARAGMPSDGAGVAGTSQVAPGAFRQARQRKASMPGPFLDAATPERSVVRKYASALAMRVPQRSTSCLSVLAAMQALAGQDNRNGSVREVPEAEAGGATEDTAELPAKAATGMAAEVAAGFALLPRPAQTSAEMAAAMTAAAFASRARPPADPATPSLPSLAALRAQLQEEVLRGPAAAQSPTPSRPSTTPAGTRPALFAAINVRGGLGLEMEGTSAAAQAEARAAQRAEAKEKEKETVLGRWDREWKALESTVAGPRGAAFGRTLKTSTNSVRAKAALQVAEGPGFVQLEIFRLGPGSSFGDTAVLAGAARRASVVANTHVEALVLSRVDLVTKLPEGALAQLTKRAEATGAGDDALFGQLEVVRIWETFKGFVRDTVLEDARRRKEIERNKRNGAFVTR